MQPGPHPPAASAPRRPLAHPAALWAVAGVTLVLVDAVVRLVRRGAGILASGLDPAEWLALLALVVLFVWGEGERGLRRRFAPHVVRRAEELGRAGRPLQRWLAPLYAMSLVGASRGGLARAWGGVLAIVAAVLVVRALPWPWRGMIDLAVAAALAWGVAGLLLEARRRWS